MTAPERQRAISQSRPVAAIETNTSRRRHFASRWLFHVSRAGIFACDGIAGGSGQLASTQQAIPRVEASIREAERLVDEQKLSFRQNAQTELNAKLSELSIVNKLHTNTVGGVVRAGEPLVEITPVEDNLRVEAKISPKHIETSE